MKLSDAIEVGTIGLMTRGPGTRLQDQALYVAARGFLGRDPTPPEYAEIYHDPRWGFPTDTEYMLRLCATCGETWAQTINRLRRSGL